MPIWDTLAPKPIRLAWYVCVLPALTLNYLGQGALAAGESVAIANPFYLLFPSWALYPAVGLATIATVIASQAVISGVFSVTKQAIQLGFLPRMQIKHTSDRTIGQIYIPFVNWTAAGSRDHGRLGFRFIIQSCVGLRRRRHHYNGD